MTNILDNEAYPVEERLEIAKVLLEMKDKQIQQLEAQLGREKSTREWIDNPDRMGGQFTQDEIDNANRW